LRSPLNNGGTLGSVPDMKTMLAGDYDEFGWDSDGFVSEEALRALGVSFEG